MGNRLPKMKNNLTLCFLFFLCLNATGQNKVELKLTGLQQSVEVIRDENGVNHIYAQNEHDLFFAQGYCAAKDRLFQFELWRRQATGTMAELLGAKEIKRDQGARLFKFRGDLKKEFNHYHPRGEQIINAFTEGINAYIKETEANPQLLPLEFKLLGMKPTLWTPEIVISRHQGLLGNLTEELSLGRMVEAIGIDKVKDLAVFEPGEPDLRIDPSIDAKLLSNPVTELYDAFRKPVNLTPQDIKISSNQNLDQYKKFVAADDEAYQRLMSAERQTIGSNNWIVSGAKSQSGFPMLANDPHRALSAPSLRYMVHLNAPGWNVLGGGEPTIPGISIGHNEQGAWGLTVFELDAEDLYVYELNPQNKNQYKYQNGWKEIRIIKDTIKVKGAPDVFVEHKYTRHGPVTFVDDKNNVAYSVRCGWMEIGGAPYMASLRIDQAKTWEEFREGCSYSHIPGENMIWADKKGNIGWQAVGVAPVRKNWDGLVPVPGDGRYEWSGYLPIKSLPSVFNPIKGFWATANENLIPSNYEHRNAVGWTWADSYRADRINEVLGAEKKFSSVDMMKLQCDYLSIPARTLVPMLKNLKSVDERTQKATSLLLNWNFEMEKSSVAAGIYAAWEKRIAENALPLFVPEKGKELVKSIPLSRIIDWVIAARPEFGKNPVADRDAFLLSSLQQAVDDLTKKLGLDMNKWQYGQAAYHHVLIKHPLSNAVDDATRKKLEVGIMPRGGNGSTPGMTTNGDNQNAGATFRIVVDVADWDKAMFTNAPGQSGDVSSPFYKNLFERWATDKHFPVYYSREKIEKVARGKLILKPLR
jgi:penicillin G amidase